MKFLEKDLEEIIYKTPNEILREKGLKIRGKKFRQLRIGNYGIADIVTYQRDGDCFIITVYELKKDKAGISAFLQCVRYAKGIRSYLKGRNCSAWIQIEIVLVARTIDTYSDYVYVQQFMHNLENYSFKYGVNGIEFNKVGTYELTNNGFKL